MHHTYHTIKMAPRSPAIPNRAPFTLTIEPPLVFDGEGEGLAETVGEVAAAVVVAFVVAVVVVVVVLCEVVDATELADEADDVDAADEPDAADEAEAAETDEVVKDADAALVELVDWLAEMLDAVEAELEPAAEPVVLGEGRPLPPT